MVVPSHLRFAAGVSVLAVGLLMGGAGGAVAVAEPDSSGSTAQGDDRTNAANASDQDSTTASSRVDRITDAVRKTMQGVAGTLGSGRLAGQQLSTGAQSPKNEPGGTDTDTQDEKQDMSLVAAVPNVVATVSDGVAPVSDGVAPVSDGVAPVSDRVAPVSDVIAAIQDMLTSVASAVVPLTQLPSDLSSMFLSGIAGTEPE
jgi:hypothetical protein